MGPSVMLGVYVRCYVRSRLGAPGAPGRPGDGDGDGDGEGEGEGDGDGARRAA